MFWHKYIFHAFLNVCVCVSHTCCELILLAEWGHFGSSSQLQRPVWGLTRPLRGWVGIVGIRGRDWVRHPAHESPHKDRSTRMPFVCVHACVCELTSWACQVLCTCAAAHSHLTAGLYFHIYGPTSPQTELCAADHRYLQRLFYKSSLGSGKVLCCKKLIKDCQHFK